MVAYIATNTKEMDKETLVNNLKEAGFIQTRD
uniref:Polysaccharide biosynthesis protein C-terminal n=1 Tax=virus sp. ct9pU4 TaxID=2828248 RepID=A0A8S5RBE7_9VIRU|nr:MAG TPA: Polysaccharide biosynthesis protein C-terminal [virus sp. ct9pU4]